MVANLRADNIDGFLGPDPFNQRAVFDGIGFIHVLTKEFWDGHPCCAFAVPRSMMTETPNTFAALMRSIVEATAYASKAENRREVAQAIAGQRWGGDASFADRRVRAAIALSPSAPFVSDTAAAFGRIGVPFLSITGTADGAPLQAPPDARAAAVAQRSAPYRGMPPGDKWLLIFDGADHMVFSGNARRAERPVDAHVKAVTIAATSAFWGATLLENADDKAFLATGLKATLAPGDRLERK
jgi:pimeloyl-ACP methyl ester carboxylesterase